MNDLCTADAHPEIEHWLADSEDVPGLRAQSVLQDVKRCRLGKQQRSAKEAGFCFDLTIVGSRTILIRQRAALVPEEAMGEFMADVATLTMLMVCVVVDDCGLETDMGHHSGELPILRRLEQAAVAGKLRHRKDIDIEFSRNGDQVQTINWRKANFFADFACYIFSFSLESASKGQIIFPLAFHRPH